MSFPIEKALIIGASVSAASVEHNPVKRLLRRHGVLSGAITHAQNGWPSSMSLESFDFNRLAQVSCVISVDLFFWDSAFGNPSETREWMHKFFASLNRYRVPMIVGNIPVINLLQVNAREINSALVQATADSDLIHLLDLDQIFQRVRGKGLAMDGRLYPESELMPDGLHPSPAGAEFLSRELENRIGQLMSQFMNQSSDLDKAL